MKSPYTKANNVLRRHQPSRRGNRIYTLRNFTRHGDRGEPPHDRGPSSRVRYPESSSTIAAKILQSGRARTIEQDSLAKSPVSPGKRPWP